MSLADVLDLTPEGIIVVDAFLDQAEEADKPDPPPGGGRVEIGE